MSQPASSPRAAYVHVPFCRHRCGYCDFTLIAGRDDLIDAYLAGLERELRAQPLDPAEGRTELETLFLGGGTPTHPAAPQLRRLFASLRSRFDWGADAEVSVEANPLDLTDEKLAVLRDAGVNRLSLGVQSFTERTLTLLERDHRPDDVRQALGRTLRRFDNVAVDLIFGVPGQSLAEWRDALRQAVELGAVHISTYGLTFEPGTAFWTRRRRGQLQPVDEELEREMYAAAMDDLAAAGFVQYEISNFARPGRACRHNETYWRGDDYGGYGPGAARYLLGRREMNIRSVLGWLARLQRGLSTTHEVDELSPEGRARELIYLGLRMTAGVERSAFARRTGYRLEDLAGEALPRNVAAGLLADDAATLRLTRAGRFLADRVATDFL